MKKTNFKLFTMFLAGILFSTFAVFAATISVPTNFTTNAVQYLQQLVLKDASGTTTGIVLDGNSGKIMSNTVCDKDWDNCKTVSQLITGSALNWYLTGTSTFLTWEAWKWCTMSLNTSKINCFEDDPVLWGWISVWNLSGNDIYYNTGNVGIWTGTPSEKLHVYWATQIGQSLKLFSNTDTNANPTIEALGNAKPIVFMTSWSESMRITAASKVGIGTNNPKAKLQVNGNVKFSSIGEGTWEFIIQDDPNGTEAMRVDMQNKRLIFDSNNDWYNVGIWTASPSSKLEVVWNTKISGNLNVDGNSLYVDATNNYVGIGKTPWYKLDVNGTGRFSSIITNAINWIEFIWSAINNVYMYVGINKAFNINRGKDITKWLSISNLNGDVWIGTDTPSSKLDVEWTWSFNDLLVSWKINTNKISAWKFQWYSESDYMNFWIMSGWPIRTWNLWINEHSIMYSMFNTTHNTNTFVIWERWINSSFGILKDDWYTALSVDWSNEYNVWIWNDSPYQKLDVNGAIKIWYPATNTWCNSSSNEWTLAYHHISWWSEIVICMLKDSVHDTYWWVTIVSATGWVVSNPALNNSGEIGDLWWS